MDFQVEKPDQNENDNDKHSTIEDVEQSRHLRLKAKVLNEIISSEESYISQLDLLLNVSKANSSNVISATMLVFCNRVSFGQLKKKAFFPKATFQPFLVTLNLSIHLMLLYIRSC